MTRFRGIIVNYPRKLLKHVRMTVIEVYVFLLSNVFLSQNKKQRKMVREAVLKSKDPQRILEEIEKIESMGN